mmetsp:Transcript_25417/g.78461  ORF Transcript_25417/g.78461 Transcript_25417/m.78461 type:complete len:238 (+) Transcript_25417:1857-2570(+)
MKSMYSRSEFPRNWHCSSMFFPVTLSTMAPWSADFGCVRRSQRRRWPPRFSSSTHVMMSRMDTIRDSRQPPASSTDSTSDTRPAPLPSDSPFKFSSAHRWMTSVASSPSSVVVDPGRVTSTDAPLRMKAARSLSLPPAAESDFTWARTSAPTRFHCAAARAYMLRQSLSSAASAAASFCWNSRSPRAVLRSGGTTVALGTPIAVGSTWAFAFLAAGALAFVFSDASSFLGLAGFRRP